MIHITLGPREEEPADDPLHRPYHGWYEGMSDKDCYQFNRGRWVLGERADRERYALFSARDAAGVKLVRLAIEIDEIEDAGEDRRAMVGRILAAGHPVYDRYVGGPSPVERARNPVNYVTSGLDDEKYCACGCGEPTTLGRDFLPGHDQRAIHDRIAQVGGVREFLRWFDATWRPSSSTH